MKRIKFGIFLLTGILAVASCAERYPYQNASLTPDERADDLIGRLTLEQKVSLLNYASPAIPELGIQQYYWWNEALHGTARNGLATVFPQAIGMGASWDNELVQQVFDVASTEQRIKFNTAREGDGVEIYHGLTVWTPNINIFRDPRWGRGQETYGEDPYLMTVMGRSVVNGLQGDPDAKHDKLHACLKHFAVHSGPEHNRHIFNVEEVSWRDLNETYLYAFERLVKTTDVKEVMCAYQAFEGKPCCGNDKLLTKILREQWGFKGLVVTDCWAVRDFHTEGCHNMYPDDPAAATAHAVRSGSDLECGTSFPALVEAVQKGLIPESDIDVSLHRLLKARFELGEMDPQRKVKWSKIPADRLACDEHRALALDMARKSMTLLQNNNSVLPLKKDARYAVVGPNAADSVVMWGNYNGDPRKTVTVLEGIQAKVGAENVVYAPGCDIALLADARLSDEFDAAMFADVDAIIFVGGLSPMLEGEEQPVKAVEEWDMDSDEMKYQLMPVDYVGFNKGDRTSIELPATQRQYIRNLASLGKPLVFVNLSGSAIALAPEAENCDAILQAWYGGEAGGTAVADVLFGDYNPAGRLPLTFYSSDADLPGFEDYDMENRTYRYFKGTPLFPFGHGLSYTTFEYGDAALSDGVLTVPVTNTGSLDGEEVVQVYVKSVADVDGPIKSLRGFKRVPVKAGETVNVEVPFEIDLFNPETGKMEASAGEYLVYYGGSSDESKLKVISYNL